MKFLASVLSTTLTLSATLASAEVIWSADFNDWKSKWNPMFTQMGNSNIVDMGTTMRCNFPAGIGNASGGCQFPSQFPENVKGDDLYLSYNLRFSDNFEFVMGGKLPGLKSGDGSASGGNHPNGTNGFTARIMWRPGPTLETYLYVPQNQKAIPNNAWGWGEDMNVNLKGGKWYNVEQRIKLNTPGQYDGVYQQWVDGELKINQSGLFFRSNDFKIDGIYFSTFYGGNGPEWAPKTQGNYVEFKDFQVATSPINGETPPDHDVFLVDPEEYVGEAPDGVDDIGVNIEVEDTPVNEVITEGDAEAPPSKPVEPVKSAPAEPAKPEPVAEKPTTPAPTTIPEKSAPAKSKQEPAQTKPAPSNSGTGSNDASTKTASSETDTPKTETKPFNSAPKPESTEKSVFVSPNGSNTGNGSFENPMNSIEKAVNQAVPGDTVFLDDGTYQLDRPQTFRNNGTAEAPINIRPFNPNGNVQIDAATIRSIVEEAVIRILGQYLNFSGLNVNNAPSDAISMQGNNLALRNSNITNAGGNGITIGSNNSTPSNNIRLEENNITGVASAGATIENASEVEMENNVISDNGNDGIKLNNVKQTKLSNNIISDNKNSNIAVESGDNVTIQNNKITSKNKKVENGVKLGGNNKPVRNAIVENNVISNVDNGIAIKNTSGQARVKNASVKNNRIYGNQNAALSVEQPKSGVNSVTMDSNIIAPTSKNAVAQNSQMQGTRFVNNCFDSNVEIPTNARNGSNKTMDINDPESVESCNVKQAEIPKNNEKPSAIEDNIDSPRKDEPTQLAEKEVTMEHSENAQNDVVKEPESKYQSPVQQPETIVQFIREMITSIITSILQAIFGFQGR